LTAASFPTITSPTLAQLSAFTGGNCAVSWTLPAGLINDDLNVSISDNSGNSASVYFSLSPTDESKSFTLNPVTSTGQTFTITNEWICLDAVDSYGRQIATTY
jgi:hypothetical protein